MDKDIELLTELKEQFVKVMGAESKRPILDVDAVSKFSGYIRALSHAIDMMKEAGNDTEV